MRFLGLDETILRRSATLLADEDDRIAGAAALSLLRCPETVVMKLSESLMVRFERFVQQQKTTQDSYRRHRAFSAWADAILEFQALSRLPLAERVSLAGLW